MEPDAPEFNELVVALELVFHPTTSYPVLAVNVGAVILHELAPL